MQSRSGMELQTKTRPQNASRVYAHKNAVNQVVAFGPVVRVTFSTEGFDGLSEFNNAVGNYYFQPIRAGYYLFAVQVECLPPVPAGFYMQTLIQTVLAANIASQYKESAGVAPEGMQISKIVHLTPNDQVIVNFTHNVPAGVTINGQPSRTWLTIQRTS